MTDPALAVPDIESICGWVDCRVIESRCDSTDPNTAPDVRGVPGKVTFSPLEKVVRGRYADGTSAYVLRRDVPAILDEDGWLWTVDPDTGEKVQRKVPLVIGHWRVTFQAAGTITRDEFTVTADHSHDAPLDLVDAVSDIPPGTTVTTVPLPPMAGQAGKFMGTDGNKLVWLASAVRVSVASTRTAAEGEQPSVTADADNRLSFVLPAGAPGPKGDKGDKGDPSTVPGPPNVLKIGTVSTGAAGSNASASITGTSPDQTLNLTIPQGLVGPAGPTFGADGSIIAAGRPDVAATMDADTQAKVAAAPSGALFRSTDGPQGAWVWMKRGAAWVGIDCDTGWRVITSWDTAGTITGIPLPANAAPRPGQVGRVMVRRVGQEAHWFMNNISFTGEATFNNTYVPRQFYTSGPFYTAMAIPYASGLIGVAKNSWLVLFVGAAGQHLGLQGVHLRFITGEGFPTTLPGIPA